MERLIPYTGNLVALTAMAGNALTPKRCKRLIKATYPFAAEFVEVGE